MVQVLSRSIGASGCFNCRLSLIRAFTAVSSIPSYTTYPRLRNFPHSNDKQTRLSSSSLQQYSISSWITPDGGGSIAEEEAREEDSGSKKAESARVPWYLQVEPPSKPPRPLSERQRIPDLPKSSPAIMQPLLQQLSIDLGLDDLALLDLRELDPPPALGANLFMIIGTARSEKHLHVAADRLCRWLRSEYKLRPDADGLLGRNELKLKMRRKNKRAKLLGSGTSNDDGDDGVRTGWVCVNVGTVENATAPGESLPQVVGFIGFGKQAERVKIVVQLLVEEKREELDLEKLWSGILKRRTFAESGLLEESTGAAEEESDIHHSSSLASAERFPRSNSVQSTATVTPLSIQSRGFHTGSRFFVPVVEATPLADPSFTQPSSAQDQPTYTNVASLHEQVMLLLNSGKPMKYVEARRLTMAHRFTVAELQNDRWRIYLLNWLRSYIESLPLQIDFKLHGKNSEYRSSSQFLHCFYETISPFPSPTEWEFKVWLHCFARKLRHRAYSTKVLSKFFEDLQLSGTTISNETYIQLLRSTLRPIPWAVHQRPDIAQRELAVKILQDMYDRTGNILTEDVFVALQESLAVIPKLNPEFLRQLSIPPNADITTCDLPIPNTSVRSVQSRVDALMSTFHVRVLNDENRIRLMDLYAKKYNWVDFWRLWRSIAREGEARSPALWARMFQLVALTGHQRGCMNVLRTWIPDMDREEPEVKPEGELLVAVKACLQVADPSMDKEKIGDPAAKGEWINLWRRCLGIQ